MKLNYDQIPVEIDTSGLTAYAQATLKAMQKADPEFADCWTACSITFEDLNPVFEWGLSKMLTLALKHWWSSN